MIDKERKISLPNLVKINAEDLIQKTGENKKSNVSQIVANYQHIFFVTTRQYKKL